MPNPIDWMTNSLGWLLGYRGIPRLARPTFRYDLLGTFFAYMGVVMMVGSVTQLFLLNSLRGSPWFAPVLVSGVTSGHLVGGLAADILQRRRRVPYIIAARVGMAVVMLVIALLPVSRASVVPYALLIIAASMLSAISLNIQSAIWQSNYPQHLRGRIVSRLLMVRFGSVLIGSAGAAAALDRWPWAHHLLYSLSAMCLLLSAAAFSRIRVRREKYLLRMAHRKPRKWLAGLRLLLEDRAYARYVALHMMTGSMVHMVSGMLVPAFADIFGVSYSEGIGSMVVVPTVIMLVGLPLAGHIFDRSAVMRFRGVNTTFWASFLGLLFAGLWLKSWPLVIGAFVVRGIAQSSGGVLWNVAHTRFAPPSQAQLYMGLHMTLVGLRGLVMPFVGMLLYTLMGLWMLPVAFSIAAMASLGFYLAPEPPTPREPDAEEEPEAEEDFAP
jgi:MFS family permease